MFPNGKGRFSNIRILAVQVILGHTLLCTSDFFFWFQQTVMLFFFCSFLLKGIPTLRMFRHTYDAYGFDSLNLNQYGVELLEKRNLSKGAVILVIYSLIFLDKLNTNKSGPDCESSPPQKLNHQQQLPHQKAIHQPPSYFPCSFIHKAIFASFHQ